MVSTKPKISLIGAGQIGNASGLIAVVKKLGDVHLVDVLEGLAEGKALDLSHLAAVEDSDIKVTGGTDFKEIRNSDVVIVTAGLTRKAGMKREDMLEINAKIITNVGRAIKEYCPDAFIICLTNPLDSMTRVMQQATGAPYHRVVGMAGALDGARFKALLAERLGVSLRNISTMVLGGHGDLMIPLTRYTTVCGVPLHELITLGVISQEEVEDYIEQTRRGGETVIKILGVSAFNAPAAAAIKIAEAYIYGQKLIMACCTYLNGEYGVYGTFAGVPVVIGGSGVEKILELPMTEEESAAFKRSIKSVAELDAKLDALRAEKTGAVCGQVASSAMTA